MKNRNGDRESNGSGNPNPPSPLNREGRNRPPDSPDLPSGAGERNTAANSFEQAADEARAIPTEEAAPGPLPSPAEPSEPENVEAIKQGASSFVAEMLPFGVLAQFRIGGVGGPHWRITKEQVEVLAPLWCQLLDKYIPNWWKDIGPEAQLLVVLVPLVVAKLQEEKREGKAAASPVASKPESSTAPAGGGKWAGGPSAAPPA